MLMHSGEPDLRSITSARGKPSTNGWAAHLYLKAYGVRIGIRCNKPSVLRTARSYLPIDWEVGALQKVDRIYSLSVSAPNEGMDGHVHTLCADDAVLLRSAMLENVLHKLEGDVRLTVADRARHRVFVHAGVVGWKGKAIVIPGRSLSGKSSLVAELVRRGGSYYSDEYAVCDSRGRVHPFHKPLELRKDGERNQFKVDIEQLSGELGTKPLRVGLVLMTKFSNTATWKPRELPPGKGVLELLSQTVSARRNPEKAFASFEQLVRGATVLKGVRGEAAEMVDKLLTRYANW